MEKPAQARITRKILSLIIVCFSEETILNNIKKITFYWLFKRRA
jgi:hypothetical protein